MDTITLIRSAIRGLLRVADDVLEAELRAVLGSGDDYASSAKPQIDWDDSEARDALIDSRAKDAFACLAVLDGRELDAVVTQAGELLATVVGQDLEETDVRAARERYVHSRSKRRRARRGTGGAVRVDEHVVTPELTVDERDVATAHGQALCALSRSQTLGNRAQGRLECDLASDLLRCQSRSP